MSDDPKNDVADAVARAAQVARSALERAGEAVSELLSGLGGGEAPLTTGVVPEVLPLHPVEGGAEVATRVRLVNSSDGSTEPFTLTATDLVSGDGEARIPADAVSVGPEQRVLAGGTTDTVRVTVAVPEGAAPGVYSGELQPSESAVAPAALKLEVR
jgi:hypothetical protein